MAAFASGPIFPREKMAACRTSDCLSLSNSVKAGTHAFASGPILPRAQATASQPPQNRLDWLMASNPASPGSLSPPLRSLNHSSKDLFDRRRQWACKGRLVVSVVIPWPCPPKETHIHSRVVNVGVDAQSIAYSTLEYNATNAVSRTFLLAATAVKVSERRFEERDRISIRKNMAASRHSNAIYLHKQNRISRPALTQLAKQSFRSPNR